ncbi:MAG: hypothetical protein D6712_02255 [Chloroflexi bacterium]|nr:MAG: hypothetical protein D6712_02255 [Chloroflexota bacterium]
MANYSIEWLDDNHTIVYIKVLGDWSWEEAHEAISKQVEMAKTVSHGVHVILDFNNQPTLPNGFGVHHIRELMTFKAPNELLTVFIGAPRLLSSLLNLIRRVYGLRNIFDMLRFTDNLEEALQEIALFDEEHAPDHSD